jgi:hypothetical protein
MGRVRVEFRRRSELIEDDDEGAMLGAVGRRAVELTMMVAIVVSGMPIVSYETLPE